MDSPEAILKEIANRRVLVVGDTIVDVNTYCEAMKALDDGTPVYRKVLGERGQGDHYSLGGAALVVRNLLELGAKVDFLTGVGYGSGATQAANLHHANLSLHALRTSKAQTVKHRFWANGDKLAQVDQVDNTEMSGTEQGWLHDTLDWIMERNKPEIVVVADYRHGLISNDLAAHLVARTPTPPVLVSSQVSQQPPNHDWYAGASAFVLNQTEAASVLARFGDQYDADYVEALRDRLKASTVIVTCGAEGCLSADDLVGGCRTLPVFSVRTVDDCGAGDAFLAAYAVTGMLSFANMWAALSCTVAGANPPTKEMLKPYARGIERDVLGKDRNGAGPPGGHEADHDERGNALFS